jgi:hexosaminidase
MVYSSNSWCDPFKSWQHSYTFDPTANLTEAEAQLVLGGKHTFISFVRDSVSPLAGQHLLWAEQSSPNNLDDTVWPRAASSAGSCFASHSHTSIFTDQTTFTRSLATELFWSGPELTNVTNALPRLHDVSFRMQKRGTRSNALQPLWCALRPHACDLTA